MGSVIWKCMVTGDVCVGGERGLIQQFAQLAMMCVCGCTQFVASGPPELTNACSSFCLLCYTCRASWIQRITDSNINTLTCSFPLPLFICLPHSGSVSRWHIELFVLIIMHLPVIVLIS